MSRSKHRSRAAHAVNMLLGIWRCGRAVCRTSSTLLCKLLPSSHLGSDTGEGSHSRIGVPCIQCYIHDIVFLGTAGVEVHSRASVRALEACYRSHAGCCPSIAGRTAYMGPGFSTAGHESTEACTTKLWYECLPNGDACTRNRCDKGKKHHRSSCK